MDLLGRIINAVTNLHPMHSPVVHFPIGLTGAALLFILLALWRRNESLEHAAFFSIALAAVSTLAAGLTGMRDNVVRFDGGAPYISAKIFLAVTMLILTAATAVIRWRQREVLWKPTTMVLYVLAFAGSFGLAMVLGFLGGAILYGL